MVYFPRRISLVAAFLTLQLAAAVPARAQLPSRSFVATPCTGDFSKVAQKVDCGYVTVEETRGARNGRNVILPVAIVHAAHPKVGLPPVFFLNGGPGGSFIQKLAERLSGPIGRELVAQDQDWIFFDHRGNKLTVPALDCGEIALTDAGPLSDVAAAGLQACGMRHAAAGVDLSRYNSLEVTRDLQDLRRALNINRFDIIGVSYGTRVGFSVIARQSAGVRAAVLDSVWPQDANWAVGGPQMISAAVKAVFARCAVDPKCRKAYPDPTHDLNLTATRFLAKPVKRGEHTYSADDLGGFLMDTLYDADGARSLPRDVHAFAKGDYSALDAQIADRSAYTEAQHLAFLCKERFAFEHKAQVTAAANDKVGQLTVESMKRYFDVCQAYPVGDPDLAENRPVSSDIPTFFLSAQFDPGCPPELARAAVARFSHGQYVLFPNTTHALYRNSSCARHLIRAFFADPNARLDTSCITSQPDRFAFKTN
ncbi:MAG: alpha/beta hydrolase [Sphingomicrobium sp.]